jgi:head-tail adaptor
MSYFVHPRLMTSLTPIMVSTATIQEATEIRDPAGQPVKTWSDLLGHVALPCNINTTGGGESKAANQVYATATHEILLQGYYPLITPKHRMIDGSGAIYDILLVNQDPFQAFTKLVAEIKH